jgi:hypothetical protein
MSDKWIKLSEQAAEDTRLLRERQETEMVDLLTQQTAEIDALRAEITRLTEALRQEWVADQDAQGCASQLRHYGDHSLWQIPAWVYPHCGLPEPDWSDGRLLPDTFREYWERHRHTTTTQTERTSR